MVSIPIKGMDIISFLCSFIDLKIFLCSFIGLKNSANPFLAIKPNSVSGIDEKSVA